MVTFHRLSPNLNDIHTNNRKDEDSTRASFNHVGRTMTGYNQHYYKDDIKVYLTGSKGTAVRNHRDTEKRSWQTSKLLLRSCWTANLLGEADWDTPRQLTKAAAEIHPEWVYMYLLALNE